MKKVAAIFGLGILILSFQNCSSPEHLVQGQIDREVIYEKIKAMPVSEISFWDNQNGLRIDVDLNSGVMTAYEEMGQVRGDRFCLPEINRMTLNEILADASICQPEPNLSGNVCAQVYHPAYASLTLSTTTYNLGERLDSCSAPVDLCDPLAPVLEAFVESTLLNLSNYQCP